VLAGLAALGGVALAVAANRQGPKGEGGGAPERVEIRGIENTFRLSERLYSGGDPNGIEGLEGLKALGVRTVISVDGAAPDAEAARALGLRYVHLPIGYDGVPREQAVRLVRALKTLPGPVYVHCHHGKHRGPAAAAVCGIAVEGWSAERAVAWMEEAGTAPEYAGLYETVRGFVPPSDEELARAGEDLPERAEIPEGVATMVQVDAGWDRLKAIRDAGFAAPADQPDLDPPHEALLLVEAFRELARLPEAKARGAAFLDEVAEAEVNASRLESALRALAGGPDDAAREAAESAFLAAGRSCTPCLGRYRDRIGYAVGR
jgi:protein tyrosine phosphatase (PTP) superfamily phosphohydrolase (DUF442 family)